MIRLQNKIIAWIPVTVTVVLNNLKLFFKATNKVNNPKSPHPNFPKMLAHVVRIGEETGSMDTQLETLAEYYEEEVDRALENLTGLLEPGMIIFVGIIVAFVAISVILPMYSLLGQIK